jgi:uncharacterized protein GlcG (DUF336 family)
MTFSRHRRLFVAAGVTAVVVASGLAVRRPAAVAQDASIAAAIQSLSRAEATRIADQGVVAAATVQSILRRVPGPNNTFVAAPTRMHVAVVDRLGRLLAFRSMSDAWEGSKDIAIAKARTAAFFSSNENALTSRTIGVLAQAHDANGAGGAGPLWGIWESNKPGITGNTTTRNGIITFPGGVPLYKSGVLVGGVGVSGDGVDQDEQVAVAASAGFEAPAEIRSTAAGLPYTK